MKIDHYYVSMAVALAAFIAVLIAYLLHSDDVTKGLTAASFGALLALINPGKTGGSS